MVGITRVAGDRPKPETAVKAVAAIAAVAETVGGRPARDAVDDVLLTNGSTFVLL